MERTVPFELTESEFLTVRHWLNRIVRMGLASNTASTDGVAYETNKDQTRLETAVNKMFEVSLPQPMKVNIKPGIMIVDPAFIELLASDRTGRNRQDWKG